MLNFGNQNTLPEQVAINKANIEALAAEVEKLGYTPKGEYSASAEYVYNDVVFYNYKLYAMIDKDAVIVGVAPTDTTKWQAVTGDIKGQQGQQGPAGDDGQAGADGKDALVFNSYTTAAQTPIVNTNANIDNDQFNRDPVVGDVFEAFFVNSTTGHTYFIIYQAVAIVSASVTQFKVKYVIDITGKQGEDGQIALVYDQTIAFTYSASQQLITADLPFANFNRTPELNEDFIAILKDSGVEYLANCEVQTISGSNVTSIVASNITKVSGADGQDGTNGTNGVDALAYTEIFRRAAAPVVSDAITMTLSKFTRTPNVNEKIVFVYEDTANNLTYQVQANIDSVTVESGTVGVSLEYVYQLTGPQGPAGTVSSRYMHNVMLKYDGANTYKGIITFEIITDSSAPFTFDKLRAKLREYYFTSSSYVAEYLLPACGQIEAEQGTGDYRTMYGIRDYSNQSIMAFAGNVNNYQSLIINPNFYLIQDRVYQIV